MPVPRYRYLPVKGGQYRLLADTADDLSPVPGTHAAPPLRAVTTVADADLAARLAGHLAAAADREFTEAVTGEEPPPLPAVLCAPADLPQPVARAVSAELATVRARLTAEADEPGSDVWLARQVTGCFPLHTAAVVPAGEPDRLLLSCRECPCHVELAYQRPRTSAPGWEQWALGVAAVAVTWREAVGACDGCDCHCLGEFLPGANPLAALLADVGRTWSVTDPGERLAVLVDVDLVGGYDLPIDPPIDPPTDPDADPATDLSADPSGGAALDGPRRLPPSRGPVLLLTDLRSGEQYGLGCHATLPGRWFTATRAAALDRVPDHDDVDGYLARTVPAQPHQWTDEPQPVELPAPTDPDDPCSWPEPAAMLGAALAAHRVPVPSRRRGSRERRARAS